MKYGLVFLFLGVACAAGAVTSGSLWTGAPLAAAGLSFTLVGLAFLGAGPRLFLKHPAGHLSPGSYLLHWPYHALNGLALLLVRAGRERPMDEIVPGLYLGRQLTPFDRHLLREGTFSGILDLTSEFCELPELRDRTRYRCIPLLDTTAPTPKQLEDGVAFIRERLAEGPVLVHCALGHGRSASFVVAYLLASGAAADLSEAVERVREKRPGVGLSAGQVSALERWWYDRPVNPPPTGRG